MTDHVKKPIGEILKDMDRINDTHIQEALDEQKLFAKRFGEILIERGISTPEDVMEALSIQLQTETPAVPKSPETFIERLRHLRVPISIKLSILMTLLVAVIMIVSSYFHFRNQREEFIRQMEIFGSAMVSSFARNSSVALLENDDASLNILIADVSKITDIAYAMVLDKQGIIKAHIDLKMIDQPYTPVKNAETIRKDDNIHIQKFRMIRKDVLDFSMPILFNQVLIGTIHLGISLETLEANISRARLFVIVMTLALSFVSVVLSLIIGTQFARPIRRLVSGTNEIKDGNFEFRVSRAGNDEVGDLTLAFNDMAEGLLKKEIIQDAFGRYVTPEIVDMILKNPDQKWLKGKKIFATVMFADIRGFTAFSEKTEPEEVVRILNEHFTMATDIILKHGGHIDKFIGDEILAVFGALVEYDDHALRAVTAAVTLQNQLAALNADAAEPGRMPIRIGIGINTGELVSGNIGSRKRMEYTVIGDTVNLASRLTRLAAPGEIVISQYVFDILSDMIDTEKLEPVMVKGKSDPVQTYKVKDMTVA